MNWDALVNAKHKAHVTGLYLTPQIVAYIQSKIVKKYLSSFAWTAAEAKRNDVEQYIRRMTLHKTDG